MKPAWVIAAVLSAAGGCQENTRTEVRGRVTFKGQPVTEGTVQFSDARTGESPEAALQPDGTYRMTVPNATYAVSVLPLLTEERTAEGPPGSVYKRAPNIPARYRDPAKSGLSTTVGPGRDVFDIDMLP